MFPDMSSFGGVEPIERVNEPSFGVIVLVELDARAEDDRSVVKLLGPFELGPKHSLAWPFRVILPFEKKLIRQTHSKSRCNPTESDCVRDRDTLRQCDAQLLHEPGELAATSRVFAQVPAVLVRRRNPIRHFSEQYIAASASFVLRCVRICRDPRRYTSSVHGPVHVRHERRAEEARGEAVRVD